MYEDWSAEEPDPEQRNEVTWEIFVKKMKEFYKPAQNVTLKNNQFRSISQERDESFQAFCNRVDRESRHCYFKCTSKKCTAEETAVRDQIMIGTNNDIIHEEALLKAWDLKSLRVEGVKMESATKSGLEISGDNVKRIGTYSYNNIRKARSKTGQYNTGERKRIRCFYCDEINQGIIIEKNAWQKTILVIIVAE